MNRLCSIILTIAFLGLPIGPVLADWAALDGNRNPMNIKGLTVNGAQEQQFSPSDVNGVPFSQSNPQYFNLLINGFLPTAGQAVKANSLPVALPSDPDVRPAPATITAVDTSSSTGSGQNGASIVTGSPTLNSFVTQAINGASTARLQLSGSWVGTLALEQSVDGGSAYGAMGCHINGTLYSGSQVTGNGIFDCELAGATNFRVRATSFVSGGTAVLTETITSVTGVVKILNSVAIKDNASGAALTIKPASTAPAATDPAVVVTLSPNTGEVGTPATGVTQPTGGIGISGWLSAIYQKLAGTLTVLTTAVGTTSTDASGTIATGGTYQTIVAASGTRKGCLIQNPATATEVFNVKFGTMANPFTLLAGMSIGCSQGGIVLQDAVTATAATGGHAFSATVQ
jgi:hypothetical protein